MREGSPASTEERKRDAIEGSRIRGDGGRGFGRDARERGEMGYPTLKSDESISTVVGTSIVFFFVAVAFAMRREDGAWMGLGELLKR